MPKVENVTDVLVVDTIKVDVELEVCVTTVVDSYKPVEVDMTVETVVEVNPMWSVMMDVCVSVA